MFDDNIYIVTTCEFDGIWVASGKNVGRGIAWLHGINRHGLFQFCSYTRTSHLRTKHTVALELKLQVDSRLFLGTYQDVHRHFVLSDKRAFQWVCKLAICTQLPDYTFCLHLLAVHAKMIKAYQSNIHQIDGEEMVQRLWARKGQPAWRVARAFGSAAEPRRYLFVLLCLIIFLF